MKKDLLKKLEDVYIKFTPKSAIEKWSHVFALYFRHPSISKYESDYEKREKEIEKLRLKALEEIYNSNADFNIEDLVHKVSSPNCLGDTYVRFEKDTKNIENLVKKYNFSSSEEKKRVLSSCCV